MQTIESKNLIYRPVNREDTDMILRWRNSDEVRRYFLYREEITPKDHMEWLDTKVATGKVIQFIIIEKERQRPIGSVYFRDIDADRKQAQYGIFIGETDARGKGYGSETAVRMVEFFFYELKYNRLYLKVLARNDAAIRSYERAGFKIEKTCDAADDYDKYVEEVIYMSIVRDQNLMYSIVIPCYRSAETIEKVVTETAKAMDEMDRKDYEFILVNDCSPDNGNTIGKLRELTEKYNFVKAVDLAKNSGQHNAMMAGLRSASGDVFISMDDDMQTRPSELYKMFKAFDKGYDVVYGAYPEKKESMFRRFGSWVNKMCAVVFLGRPKELRTSSYWIIRRYVRDSIISYKGSRTYLLGLILRATSNITQVEVEHFEREIGSSGYTLRALLRLWSNIIGFTVKPLRLAMQAGMFISAISVISAIAIFVRKLVNPSIDPGWSSIMVAVFFSLGMELFFVGMIGEYIGRTYMHINSEPQYVIRELYGFDPTEDKSDV